MRISKRLKWGGLNNIQYALSRGTNINQDTFIS